MALILLTDRYERSTVRLASNMQFVKCEMIFEDSMTAEVIDRPVHGVA